VLGEERRVQDVLPLAAQHDHPLSQSEELGELRLAEVVLDDGRVRFEVVLLEDGAQLEARVFLQGLRQRCKFVVSALQTNFI
jgi:hypothetical protein